MRELGRRYGDADLEALGLAFQGLVATRSGSLEEGGRLLDEAMASAVGGELGMLATGVICCRMISAPASRFTTTGGLASGRTWSTAVNTRPGGAASRTTAGRIEPRFS
jgi:hypothetical protein